ncbi:MAG: PD40 domain-containing protein [Bacteroidales bacterium]|nr:PD40 domain-containing protein [Bacteroidales bacterium]
MRTAIIIVCAFLLIAKSTDAQFFSKIQLKHNFKEARRFISFKNYEEAIPKLAYLLKKDSLNANYNYLMGLCYIRIPKLKAKALPFLLLASKSVVENWQEYSFKERNAPYKVFFLLGEVNHMLYKFDQAENYFAKYLEYLKPESNEYKESKRMMDICKNAPLLINDSIEISIENLGPVINSEYDEHSPTLTSDENTLIFTSRRKGSTGGMKTDDGRYFEDIYVSKKVNDHWEIPEKISPNINTDMHEASICVSADGQELYIYKDDFGIGNIYASIKDSLGNWTKPVKLEPQISSSANETHATISADKNILIFSSDRSGGYGGKDLYMSVRLPNGEWSYAKNLGNIINTPYDEEGPFLLPDGYTLYFSSKGHHTLGGYDLFYSELKEDGIWSEPKNLGYPINSTEDDVYYHLSADEKRAYFSSIRDDSYGGKDIYVMNLLSLPERSAAVIKGKVFFEGKDSIPVKDVLIKVIDNKTGKLMGQYKPNKETGYYVMILKQNREYSIICENEQYEFEPKIFNVPQHSSLYEMEKPLILEPLGKLKSKTE